MANVVKIGTVPGSVKEVLVEDGATVREVIRLGGYEAQLANYKVELNSNTVDLGQEVEDGDVISLLKKISAGA